jgi:Zn-dependent protease
VNLIPSASLKIGRVGPIEIRINVTWLVIFGLLVYWLRTGFVTQAAPDLSGVLAWIVSAVGALVLFASVLAHELAHSFMALRNGLSIRKITLFIFGGVAHMESEPARPGVEFKMAVAGPLASIVIAVVLGFVRFVVLKDFEIGPAVVVLEYATYANALLACFNLIPGYPLDGGRVLRAALWKLTGDFSKATIVAATIGRVIGLGIAFVGSMLSVALDSVSFLWLVLVGSFLERLAFLSVQRARPLQSGPRVADVMKTDFAVLAPSLDLASARQYFAGGAGAHAVGEEGMVVGVLSRAHIASVPESEWGSTTVEAVMAGCGPRTSAQPGESARSVLRRMLELGIGCMPVVAGKTLVGIVSRGDLIDAMRRGY